jgi:ribose 5-phosphate isomerase A
MSPKQRAAEAAIEFVKSGMAIGLGTGSTADFFMQALSAELRSGRLRDVRAVPTSRQSERRAGELGITLTTLGACTNLDLTVDGADEIDPKLDLIKGLGGALLREKMVAQASQKLIIIADSGKCVAALGERGPLPIEVVQFGYDTHEAYFRKLGGEPKLRMTAAGTPFITDNGNFIYDCRFGRIERPRSIEEAILHRAGVVDCGLFIGIAKMALIADDQSVRRMDR